LDLEGGRVVNGCELSAGHVSIFLGHPVMIAAFESLDGRRSLRDVLDRVLEEVPVSAHLFARVKLSIMLAEATMRGLLRARRLDRRTALSGPAIAPVG